MKRILLLCAAAILCVFATSCRKSSPYNYVPEGAEAVMIFDLDATPNQSIDIKQLDRILAEDTCFLSDEQKALIKEFAADPMQMGLNPLKKFVAYCDFEDNAKGSITGGLIIPVAFEKNVTASFEKINKKFSWCNYKSIKTEDGISYIYPMENDGFKGMIIGWNGKMFVWLTSSRDLTVADLKTTFNLDRKSTITANSDFNSFSKKCKNLSLWMRCDAGIKFAQIMAGIAYDENVKSVSQWADFFANTVKEGADDFEKEGIRTTNVIALINQASEIAEGLHDSYVHAYVECTKKSYNSSVSYIWSDKISGYDYNKFMDNLIESGLMKLAFQELLSDFNSSAPIPEYSYDDFEDFDDSDFADEYSEVYFDEEYIEPAAEEPVKISANPGKASVETENVKIEANKDGNVEIKVNTKGSKNKGNR